MKLYLHIAVLIVAWSCNFIYAQDTDSSSHLNAASFHPHRLSFRVDFAVPNPLNPAWKKSMVGIYEGNATVNYHFRSGIFLGAGYKDNQFYTPPKFFIFDLKTRMQIHGGYVNVGYDIHRSPGFFISPTFRAGWAISSFSGIQCKSTSLNTGSPYQSAFAEAAVHLNFLPDPDFGISFYLSYCVVDHVWNPDYICLQDHISYNGVKKDALTSYINLGLGIYYGRGKLKMKTIN